MTENLVLFWGGVFSQWYKCEFVENGIRFSSTEQYMMYHKALLFGDTELGGKILSATDVKNIKSLGRNVFPFNEDTWMSYREEIVFKGNILKFSQNSELMDRLFLYDGKIFVEASPNDRIWGIGLHCDDKRAENKETWLGLNLLGRVITRVRDQLKKETEVIESEKCL